ncbi:MAG: TetR/AcrR family transcriptional regulator [Archangium sp.]
MARKKRVQRRGDAMVEAVYSHALALLAEVGFARFSLPEVAVRAGVNKTSLYRRWPTAAVLVRDALASAMAAPPQFVASGELRADLLNWGRGAVQFSSSPLGQAVFRALLTADAPELATLAADLRSRSAVPSALIDAAKARGAVSPSVDSQLVLSMVAGTLMHLLHVERREVDERTLVEVIDVILDGLPRRAPGARASSHRERKRGSRPVARTPRPR